MRDPDLTTVKVGAAGDVRDIAVLSRPGEAPVVIAVPAGVSQHHLD